VHTSRFAVHQFPHIRWRWKIQRPLTKGDARTRAGDDYPIRVYVIFEYDPERAGLGERIQYGAAKAIYGEYPPHSSLNYIWANREHAAPILPNAYTDRARMFPLQHGGAKAGQWVEEQRNILVDYRRAFGTFFDQGHPGPHRGADGGGEAHHHQAGPESEEGAAGQGHHCGARQRQRCHDHVGQKVDQQRHGRMRLVELFEGALLLFEIRNGQVGSQVEGEKQGYCGNGGRQDQYSGDHGFHLPTSTPTTPSSVPLQCSTKAVCFVSLVSFANKYLQKNLSREKERAVTKVFSW